MNFKKLVRKFKPGCEAELLLDHNTRLSGQITDVLEEMVEQTTTVFDRRLADSHPFVERRIHHAKG